MMKYILGGPLLHRGPWRPLLAALVSVGCCCAGVGCGRLRVARQVDASLGGRSRLVVRNERHSPLRIVSQHREECEEISCCMDSGQQLGFDMVPGDHTVTITNGADSPWSFVLTFDAGAAYTVSIR